MLTSIRIAHWLPVAALALAGSVTAGPRASATLGGAEFAGGSEGRVFMTLEEALELAFPKCEITRSTRFLDKNQKARVKELSGVPLVSGILYPYTATRRDAKTGERVLVGTAYFETHRVRSLRETMMFVVAPDATIARVEVLAFYEPHDYLPNARFYAQFHGHRLNAELSLKRGIRTVTGCSLSARAATKAARRLLAIHHVLNEEPAPKPAPSPAAVAEPEPIRRGAAAR
jgi:hypothetical protein